MCALRQAIADFCSTAHDYRIFQPCMLQNDRHRYTRHFLRAACGGCTSSKRGKELIRPSIRCSSPRAFDLGLTSSHLQPSTCATDSTSPHPSPLPSMQQPPHILCLPYETLELALHTAALHSIKSCYNPKCRASFETTASAKRIFNLSAATPAAVRTSLGKRGEAQEAAPGYSRGRGLYSERYCCFLSVPAVSYAVNVPQRGVANYLGFCIRLEPQSTVGQRRENKAHISQATWLQAGPGTDPIAQCFSELREAGEAQTAGAT